MLRMNFFRCRRGSGTVVLLCALLSLVEIHSNTEYPYISFMGNTLSNHSYVDLSQVGEDQTGRDSNTVQCHTNLHTCCRSYQGSHRGDWFAPGSDTRLLFSSDRGDIYEDRQDMVVHLARRNKADGPSGIYLCVVSTIAEHDDRDQSFGETVYVGLYASGGGDITVPGGMTFTSKLNVAGVQFTLTCISTGGPATTVTWTRDSVPVIEGNETMLNDRTLSQYTHTLTVTGRKMIGLYKCTVANNKPSRASAEYRVELASAPKNLKAVQEGPTSIRVSWSPPTLTPLGDITGYRIYYSGGSSHCGCVNVSDGSTDNFLLTGLQNGKNYDISIVVTTSQHLPSENAEVMNVGLVPGQPKIVNNFTTTTSISLSWSVPSGSVVTSYEVMWLRGTSGQCFYEDKGSATITDGISDETIPLEEGSSYSLTVAAVNAAGSSAVSLIAMTKEAAPSAAPTVNISVVTSSSIIVQWGAVDCIHHNGDITGYTVRYGVQGSAEGDRTVKMVDGDSSGGMYNISGLTLSTNYIVEVAAENLAGIGVYSAPLNTQTDNGISVMIGPLITSTSISIHWTVINYITATSYTISYSNTNTECFTDYKTVTDIDASANDYTIDSLEEGTEYTITVAIEGGTNKDTVVQATRDAAPSAAPTSVSVSAVNSSSITVRWGTMDCTHHNGDITGYSLLYIEQGIGSTQIISVSGGSVTEATISGLMSSSTYLIRVAAENSAGIGVYSDPPVIETPRSVYLTLNGDVIPKHGYVVISDIGSNDGTALICNIDHVSTNHTQFGNWFAPSGTKVGDLGTNDVLGFDINRGPMMVRLYRNTATGSPSEGIYYCVVKDAAFTQQTVYVGLYNSGGGNIIISGNMSFTVDSNFSVASPQFNLTCISTGGPATTVTWTRDSVTVIKGIRTLLYNPVTVLYTHILTVTGRLGGLYKCTVANNRPSNAFSYLTVQVASAPTNFVAVQEGQTSIRVSWIPPTPLGATTGYRIYYSGGSNGSVNVTNNNEALLHQLLKGDSYTISLVATSQHLPSAPLIKSLQLVLAPESPVLAVVKTTGNSISLSWNVTNGQVVESYEVMWGSGSDRLSGSVTSYTITGLEEGTVYLITVTAANVAGSAVSNSVVAITQKPQYNAIIGGTVSVVLIVVIIAVTVVIIVALLKNMPIKKTDHEMTTMPDSTVTEGVTTTNTACELMAEHREKLKDDYAVFKSLPVIDGAAITTTANKAYRLMDIIEEPENEYDVVGNLRGDPCRRNKVTTLPPSTRPLPSVPPSVATPTSGNVGGAKQEDV